MESPMKLRSRFVAFIALTLGTATLLDTPVSAMPLDVGLRSAPAAVSTPSVESVRVVCGRRGCYRRYGYRYGYRGYRRGYYGYGYYRPYYRPYYFGLPGLGVRVY